MKANIQDKINGFKKLAQNAGNTDYGQQNKAANANSDSLARIIRNEKEAKVFLAELETAIKIAQQK